MTVFEGVDKVTWRNDKSELTVELSGGGRYVFDGVVKIWIDDGVADTPGSIVAVTASASIPKEAGPITYEYIAGKPVGEEAKHPKRCSAEWHMFVAGIRAKSCPNCGEAGR